MLCILGVKYQSELVCLELFRSYVFRLLCCWVNRTIQEGSSYVK